MRARLARPAPLALLALLLASTTLGCRQSGGSPSPEVGSNSNWLRACDAPVDCSADDIPECACGVCTVQCQSDQDCAGAQDARCALDDGSAARSTCEAGLGAPSMTVGICLPRCQPGSCGEGQACLDETCVLAAFPDTQLCAGLAPSTEAERTRAEELLALAQARRMADDVACDGQPTSSPQPALRLSPNAMCAARALAADLSQTRLPGVIDTQGRDTQARLQLAGYEPLLWADAYALQAQSAQDALALMLQDTANCLRLGDADFTDIGVAVAGDVYVLTLTAR